MPISISVTLYSSNGTAAGIQRAQVIAWYDYIKAEMPDVFFFQGDAKYPLNFAANSMVGTDASGTLGNYANFVLPLGNALLNSPGNSSYGDSTAVGPQTNPGLGFTGSGIYGASYTAAAGIYKNLGYTASGYDGIDNDGNGFIDEYNEGVRHAPNFMSQDPNVIATIAANQANHKHVTARSEMLYALLVEGRGPLGSVFSARRLHRPAKCRTPMATGCPSSSTPGASRFNSIRWPIYYHSDIQRGQVVVNTSSTSWQLVGPYYINGVSTANEINAMLITREQDALDPNQQLMAPAWWSNGTYANANCPSLVNGSPPALMTASNGVQAFQCFSIRSPSPCPAPAVPITGTAA